jgi:hypothetical protein
LKTSRSTLACFAFCAAFIARAEAEAPIWQRSTSAKIQLGIRDKSGETSSYKVVFTVEGSKGFSLSTSLTVRYSDFGYVMFPEDFGRNWAPDGAYKWTATVNGRKATGGRFEFFTCKNGDRGVIIPFDE